MAFRHGVRGSEQATAVAAVNETTAGLIVAVGTAPINLAKEPSVNKVQILYNTNELATYFGQSQDFKKYTLSEVADCAFNLFGIAPVVFINVLDREKHSKDGTKQLTITNKKAKIEEEGIFLDSVVVKNGAEGAATLTADVDYFVKFDNNGFIDFTFVDDAVKTINCTFKQLDPSMVTPTDIIGGENIENGELTGLELVNNVFPETRLVPGILIAPGFSDNPAVNAVMKTKAQNVSRYFQAEAYSDLDTKTVKNYSKVPAWKEQNNYTSTFDFALWPQVKLADKQYRMSTQAACLTAQTDQQNGDIPYVSPSNKALQMTSLVLDDGTPVVLGPSQAEYLNGQGITTALNWIGGWRLWGNHTGCFPANTDVKDSFLANRRMHNFIQNTLILNTWQKVDDPTSDLQIDWVLDTFGMWLNSLESAGAIIGGRIEFLAADNPETSLVAGKTKFRVYLATPVPNEDIEYVVEYDVKYFQNLFE